MTVDVHIDFWALLTELVVPGIEIVVVGASAVATLVVAAVAVGISLRGQRLNEQIRLEQHQHSLLLGRERLAAKLDEYRLGIQASIVKPTGTAAGGNSYPEALRTSAILKDPLGALLVHRWRELEEKVMDADREDKAAIESLLTEIAAMWAETTYWAATGDWKPSEELRNK